MTDAFFSRTVSAAANTANVNAHSGGRKLFEEAKVPDKLLYKFLGMLGNLMTRDSVRGKFAESSKF